MSKMRVETKINGEQMEFLCEPRESRAAEQLHPIQQTFLQHAALQCGICTPGFVVAAKALLDENPIRPRKRIPAITAGNLCRCTGYDKIVRAVQTPRRRYEEKAA